MHATPAIRRQRKSSNFERNGIHPSTFWRVSGTQEQEHGHAIGVCLSGGGFRAALYGLGVARYLAEARVLARAGVICGVSGGSVAAAAIVVGVARAGPAALSDRGFEREVFEPFAEAVARASLRGIALRRWLADRLALRGRPRGLVLAEVLATALFPGAPPLAGLPVRPQLVIVATELGAGRAFRFAPQFLGSWDLGYAPPPAEMPVTTAVAASTAAPPFIPPLQLGTAGLGLHAPPVMLSLTDGGVYDNLAIEWFQGWAEHRRPEAAFRADDLIVVNASGPLVGEGRTYQGLHALNRMRKVQYAQTQATRVRWFVSELEARRQQGLYFGITADPRAYRLPSGEPIDSALTADALPSVLVAPLADLRTDFNRFSREEARLLGYHGYRSAHARFGSLRPGQAVVTPRWREFAGMSEDDAQRLARAISGPRHRVGIGERLR